jgi:hypothetical protein
MRYLSGTQQQEHTSGSQSLQHRVTAAFGPDKAVLVKVSQCHKLGSSKEQGASSFKEKFALPKESTTVCAEKGATTPTEVK